MFKTQVLIVILAFTLVGGTLGIGLLKLNQKDFSDYQLLMKSSKSNKKGPLISYSQQMREQVTKEIWFQEEKPLQCRIHSKESELFFFYDNKSKVEVVEEMQVAFGLMQEELFYLLPDGREVVSKASGKLLLRDADPSIDANWIDPSTPLTPMQLIRYFEAEKASYNYNSGLFFGENVKLWKYRVKGHTPPRSLAKEKPLMTGTAESVEFTFKGNDLQFTAHRLKATFDPKKGAV